ncbi:FtsX-like permease family protein [Micromonospora sp. NPDC048830]|uniref:FtsX-like permease family protein n=1 Tax=Micromonospora sp. NPDC048830 TaxID=3364257 RepID=UPI00371C9FC1
MRLVWRRAREARGLLLAGVVAALVAVALVTGLSEYNGRAVDAGQRSMLRAAPAEERSVLLSGAGGRDVAEFAARDRVVRDRFAAGLGGVPTRVAGARYGTGRELTGDLGAARTSDDPVFANLVDLGEVAAHAELTSGAWAVPGATPTQVTVPERVAAVLGLAAGDRVPLLDRGSERRGEVLVAGVWRPRDPTEAYWRLAPGVGATDGTATSYGPFVLDPADFTRTFPGSVSVSWLVEPDLASVPANRLGAVKQAVAVAAERVPREAGLGSSAQTVTGLDRLIDRLGRADLVGRSALLTPLLLILVLGGYALVLVAALLNEDRRAQTALLRARGAARGQLAGLAVREATLVVLPAALLAPPLAGEALRRIGGDGPAGLPLDAGGGRTVWAVALAAALGCLLAMVLPALRRAGTYVADMAARSRPTRGAAVQRASVDLALVLLAVLAWAQLRQYSSPLAGAGGRLGIDPLLAAAPIVGVLAGAVLALRLLPPATRYAERFVDRRPWTATMFGMWQAGRRPHAGPVLLLALAVGGSTLAWSLVTTWERSHADQADYAVGADLRAVERTGAAPRDRAARLAAVPGLAGALPAWRDEVRLGRDDLPTTVVALDAAAAPQVVRLDERLADEPPRTLLDRMVAARGAPAGVPLPATARRLTGILRTPVRDAIAPHRIDVTALLAGPGGLTWRVPLGAGGSDGRPVPFDVELPAPVGGQLRLVGFGADAGDAQGRAYRLVVGDLAQADAAGASSRVALPGTWALADTAEDPKPTLGVGPAGIDVTYEVRFQAGGRFAYQPPARFAVVPGGPNPPVPALLTPAVREALSLRLGDTVTVSLSGLSVPVTVVGELDAVPTTRAAGMLLDLPAAAEWLVRQRGGDRPATEWWLRVDDGDRAGVVDAVRKLPGVTVLDRRETAEAAARDPYWLGARTGLLAAALGAVLLALVGLGVDGWATARHRLGEFAVLHTLGGSPRLLARALLAEQTFLAGIGVAVGLLVGAGVAATMAPLVILTPAADRPVPEAAFVLPLVPVGLTALGLLLVALAFSAAVATGLRQRVAALQLRIGGDR